MGMFSKIKSILFDEDIVEIPVRTDELPEKEERMEKISRNSGFIDYGQEDEEIENVRSFDDDDDDTITQVIVPKEEPVVKVSETEPKREFRFPVDDYEEAPVRSSRVVASTEPKKELNPRRDYSSLLSSEPKVTKKEEKDYKKFLNKKEEVIDGKKPFKVTPVISPVYGVIKENTKMEEELITIPIKKTVDDTKPRMFGPVSFNDNPLPTKRKSEEVVKKEEKKDPIIESVAKLDRNINEIIKEPIKKEEVPIIEEDIDDAYDDYVETKEIEIVDFDSTNETPVVEEEHDNQFDDEEEVISSPNYDDLDGIETSGIEDEYLNTNEEDEISYEEEVAPTTDEVIESVANDEYEDEDAHLDDTIETDLFNLIDSMYKDNDEDEIEED